MDYKKIAVIVIIGVLALSTAATSFALVRLSLRQPDITPVAQITETPEPTAEASPTPPDSTPTDEPVIVTLAPTPTQIPVLPTAPPTGCTDLATFVQDMTIPDGTVVRPGQAFTKTWRLRNDGTCTWTTAYAIVFTGGNAMGGPAAQALPVSVAPGGSVDISINLVAPEAPGTYRGEWQLRNAAGQLFGLGADRNRPFWLQVRVEAAPAPTATNTPAVTITDWRGEYFRSRTPSGAPALVRNDRQIDFNWHGDAPDSRLPADGFSARWTRSITFEPGVYRFRTFADDGVRVWIGDTLIIDDWQDGVARENTATYAITGGARTVRVEYYENTGAAVVRFSWERVTESSFPQWQGRYWANRNFEGAPVIIRNDSQIDFNWQQGPVFAGMPADDFSVRWTRDVAFSAGVYRFHATVDDGVRGWIGDTLIIDDWRDSSVRDLTVDVRLGQGTFPIRVDYYERGGDAIARVWWERISDLPTAVPPTSRPPTGPGRKARASKRALCRRAPCPTYPPRLSARPRRCCGSLTRHRRAPSTSISEASPSIGSTALARTFRCTTRCRWAAACCT